MPINRNQKIIFCFYENSISKFTFYYHWIFALWDFLMSQIFEKSYYKHSYQHMTKFRELLSFHFSLFSSLFTELFINFLSLSISECFLFQIISLISNFSWNLKKLQLISFKTSNYLTSWNSKLINILKIFLQIFVAIGFR